jgi:hypothetical protein
VHGQKYKDHRAWVCERFSHQGVNGFTLIDSGLARLWKELDRAIVSAGYEAGGLRLLVLTSITPETA